MAVSSIIVTNISSDPQQLSALAVSVAPGDQLDVFGDMSLSDLVADREIHSLLDFKLITVTVVDGTSASTYTSAAELSDQVQSLVSDSQSSVNSPVTASLQMIADPSLTDDDVGKLMKLTVLNQAIVYHLNGGIADDQYLGKLLSLQGVQAIIENVTMTWLISAEAISRGQNVSGADQGRVRSVRGGDVPLGRAITSAVGAGEYVLVRYS